MRSRTVVLFAVISLLGACITTVEPESMVAAAIPYAGDYHARVAVEVTGPDPDANPVAIRWSSEHFATALIAWLDASAHFSVEPPEEFLLAVNMLRVEQPLTENPTAPIDADWRLYSPDGKELYFQTFVSTINAGTMDTLDLDAVLGSAVAESARNNMYLGMERVLAFLHRRQAGVPPSKPTLELRLERGKGADVRDYWIRLLESMIASGATDSRRFSEVYVRSIQPDVAADYELAVVITGMREVSSKTRKLLRDIGPNLAALAPGAFIQTRCELVDARTGSVERTASSEGVADSGEKLVFRKSTEDTTDAAARRLLSELLPRCADVYPADRAR